jgi:hypothetical protein
VLHFWGRLHVYRRAEGELFPGLTIAILVVAAVLFLRDDISGGERKWPIVRRTLGALAALTGLVSLSAIVFGGWRFAPFGVPLLSVTNPTKPLTWSLILGIGLALTSPRLRRAFATQSTLGFYGLMAFLTWLFSLGPAPSLAGKSFIDRGPYALLMFFPGFNALRVPARFWMLSILCLSVIGAIVFDRLTARLGRARVAVAVIVSLGVVADGWVSRFPLAAAPENWKAESCGGSASTGRALVELPLGHPYHDVAAMYRGMSHGRPVVNGYSGNFPPHYAALRFGLTLHDDDMLTQLARHGATDIAINADDDADGVWRKYVTSHQGAQLVCTEGRQSLYRLNEKPAGESTTNDAALPIALVRANVNGDAVTKVTDGDRTTRWESGPQDPRVMFEVDLGAVRAINALELKLGPFVEDFPRSMSIEASEDAASWREVWRGGSAGLTFVGAFTSPIDVPLRYEIPGTRARYLRLRLLTSDETYYWSIAEMKVLGS